MKKVVILYGAILFTIPALNGMQQINFEELIPDIPMADREHFERHQSPPDVIYISQFKPGRVVTMIQAENCFVRRTLRCTQNSISFDFGGVIETGPDSEATLSNTEAAVLFHSLSAKYQLLQKTAEEWLAHASN